jgi:hypothetical protein
MFHPAFRSNSTPRSLILSATMTFISPHPVWFDLRSPQADKTRQN